MSRAIAAGVLVIAAACVNACRDRPPSLAGERPAAAGITWREIGSWSGGPSRQTESFEVSMAAMRLRWKTTREASPGTGHLVVTLHSAVSGRPLQTIVDARGVASATVDVADEPRWSHLVIDAADVDWEVTLEQGYAVDPR